MGRSLPGSSVYGVLQARIQERVAIQGIFPTQGSGHHLLLCRLVLYHSATREALVFASPQQGQSWQMKEGLPGDLDLQRFPNATIPGLAEEK